MTRHTTRAISVAGLLFVISGANALAGSSSDRLHVIRPGAAEEQTGKTYAQWTAAWWQLMLSIPASQSPTVDSTGANCSRGDAAGIFFLADDGTGSTSEIVRSCTVPSNKPLLVPITEVECSNIESAPFFGATDAAREACARGIMNTTTLSSLKVTLDGSPVPNVARFRFASGPFDFTQPATDNLTGVAGPTRGRSASDGWWVLLRAPSPGTHVIHYESALANPSVGNFTQNVTYNLTVTCADQDAQNGC